MDPLSVAASLITLLGTLQTTVNYARTVWNAPEILQGIGAKLDTLKILATRIQLIGHQQLFDPAEIHLIQEALERLTEVEKSLRSLLRYTSPVSDPVSLWQRLKAARNPHTLRKASNKLAATEQQLVMVMSLMNLSSTIGIQNRQNQTTTLLEEVRDGVNCQMAASHPLKRLRESGGVDFVLSDPRIENSLGNSFELSSSTQIIAHEFSSVANECSDDISEVIVFHTPNSSPVYSPLELSRTFYPDRYTDHNPFYEDMIMFSITEVSRNEKVRHDKFHMRVMLPNREWRSVVLNTISSRGSKPPNDAVQRRDSSYQVLPGKLQREFFALLQRLNLKKGVTNISIEITQNNATEVISLNQSASRASMKLWTSKITSSTSEIRRFLCHGIPTYEEREMVRVARLGKEFLCVLNSQQCIMRMKPFSAVREHDDDFVDNFEMIQRLQGCRSIPKLTGVVQTDDIQLSGYLLPAPAQGPIHNVLEKANTEGARLVWERKERWIRQILTAFIDIHDRGIVIGDLTQRGNLWIDGDDNIIIMTFCSRMRSMTAIGGRLPPESRCSKTDTGARGQNPFCPTVYSDLFQLGLLIWGIAVQAIPPDQRHFCKWSCCTVFPNSRCDLEHADPIQLPPCPMDVPGHINTLIEYCRQEQPYERKSAKELFSTLTPIHMSGTCLPTINTKRFCTENFCCTRCDQCGAIASEEHYRCYTCRNSEFDLCPQCVESGVTCWDKSHLLMQRRRLPNGGIECIKVITPSC